MLLNYIQSAMKKAHYEILKDEGYYGEIPEIDGVYAQAETLEKCRDELATVLEEWIFFRLTRNLSIPAIDGIELKIKSIA
ncbi:MAG: type II toxin-antitoxin system HicB family antitoxin [Spirochaetia bacterium]|nr:type II toxin-antitoxin system HicB family antitoxin [Spirochaetia bacterium]